MKKILLSFVALLSIAIQTNAQLNESFSGPTLTPVAVGTGSWNVGALPTGWTQYNGDGLTPLAALTGAFGTNAWITYESTSSSGAKDTVALSTSYYTPAGISNDWLISPTFTPTAGQFLTLDGLASNGSYADGYIVKISTTGAAFTNFTGPSVLTVTAENADNWVTHAIDLSAYIGTPINVAIINNSNDKELLLINNVKTVTPPAKDGAVTSASVTRYSTPGLQTISGVFKSFGATPVTNATLNYQVGTSTPVSQTITFSPAAVYLSSGSFSFTTQANLAAGTNNIKVWVSNINGTGADNNAVNDTARTIAYVATQAVTRNVLIEEFTSSTCAPCASLNATFDPLLNTNDPNTNSRVNVVKYNMNWPSPGNDPSYNLHGAARRGFYGVNGIPFAVVNGRTQMSAHSQAEIETGKGEPAFSNVTASVTRAANNVTATCSFTPYLTITNASPIKVYQVLAEQFYNYPGASTSQKNYYHVMRKMNPDGFGVEVPSMTSGTPLNFNFNNNFSSVTTPAQLSFDLWNSTNTMIEYVVYLQDTISGHILQSGSAQVAPTGLVDLPTGHKIGMYPNPAKDFTTLAIKTDDVSNVDVKVFDIFGRVIYQKESTKLSAGKNEISINTASFLTGTYTVVVTSNGIQVTDKLTIAH